VPSSSLCAPIARARGAPKEQQRDEGADEAPALDDLCVPGEGEEEDAEHEEQESSTPALVVVADGERHGDQDGQAQARPGGRGGEDLEDVDALLEDADGEALGDVDERVRAQVLQRAGAFHELCVLEVRPVVEPQGLARVDVEEWIREHGRVAPQERRGHGAEGHDDGRDGQQGLSAAGPGQLQA